jgi:hypothetical protein
MKNRLEVIRTVAAVISDIAGILSVVIQLVALHYIMHHPR